MLVREPALVSIFGKTHGEGWRAGEEEMSLQQANASRPVLEPSSTRQPSRAGGQLPVLDYERRWPYGCNRPSISYSRFGEEVLHL